MNVNAGRLLNEYNVKYESLARYEGRRIRLTGAVVVAESESATLATFANDSLSTANLTVATVAEDKIRARTGAQPKEWPDLLVGLF